MPVEQGARRLATFPDLITPLDTIDGLPASTAARREGRDLVVQAVPQPRLIHGAGMRTSENFWPAEEAVGRSIILHIFQ